MKRWDVVAGGYVERVDVDTFLRDIEEVCKRHGFAIGHEDREGSFEIEPYSEETMEWLRNADVQKSAHAGSKAPA